VIRLVATDLDGTVVGHDGAISPRTRAALAAVQDAGLRLVFVTGRPPRWVHQVAEATGHRGLAVCANGAYVYDLHAETVVGSFPLAADRALEVVHRLREVMPDAGFGVERTEGFSHDPAYHPRWDAGAWHVAPIEELLDRPVAKLLVRDETSSGDAMLALARPVLDGLADVTHSNVNDCLLEVSAHGVSKASTLERLAASWGIEPHEVIAFGDMPNDVAMLRWAGVGYAVADAHPEVLAAVDHVTAGVDDDGVALVLEALLAG
jgi:Cof subfamily protein (haloacid dehalogenase superfamily)